MRLSVFSFDNLSGKNSLLKGYYLIKNTNIIFYTKAIEHSLKNVCYFICRIEFMLYVLSEGRILGNKNHIIYYEFLFEHINFVSFKLVV